MLAFVFLLFPTGYVRSRRWRPAAWFVGGVFALAAVWKPVAAIGSWTHPFTSSSQVTGLAASLSLVAGFLASAAMVASVAALAVRFAKSSGDERLQLKWCAAAALVRQVPVNALRY